MSDELRKAAYQIQDSKFKRAEGGKQKTIGRKQKAGSEPVPR